MGQISQLQLKETVWIHPDSVKVLQKNLGLMGSQDVIERAVFEISERLVNLELALVDLDFLTVRKIAKSLIGVSAQIGLQLFSQICADVVFCADRDDQNALVAVAKRLLRISDASLFAAIDLPDCET